LSNISENRKQKYDNKFVRKTIRFTSDEFSVIQKNLEKGDITFTEFARSSILKKKLKLPIEKELIYQLNKIGINLNQIAKSINKNEKISVLQQLVKIEKMIKEIK